MATFADTVRSTDRAQDLYEILEDGGFARWLEDAGLEAVAAEFSAFDVNEDERWRARRCAELLGPVIDANQRRLLTAWKLEFGLPWRQEQLESARQRASFALCLRAICRGYVDEPLACRRDLEQARGVLRFKLHSWWNLVWVPFKLVWGVVVVMVLLPVIEIIMAFEKGETAGAPGFTVDEKLLAVLDRLLVMSGDAAATLDCFTCEGEGARSCEPCAGRGWTRPNQLHALLGIFGVGNKQPCGSCSSTGNLPCPSCNRS